MKKEAIIQAVLNTFQLNPKAVYNYKQLSKSIGIEAQVQKLYVADLLYELTCDGILAEVEPGRFRLNSLGTVAVGIFQRRSNGRNAFLPEDGGEPIMRWTATRCVCSFLHVAEEPNRKPK